MMTHTGEPGDSASHRSRQHSKEAAAPASPPLENMTIEQLRSEVARLRDREREILELLNVQSPDRLMHDLRNLLNEVQLLRILADQAS